MTKRKYSGELNISENAQKKIEKALYLIDGIEWSGVLFYKIEGTPQRFRLEATDILILDIGNTVHTEWEAEDCNIEIAGYIADNELGEYHMGLIHSHHHMSSNFSGDDLNTLRKEGMEKPFFLSLIVNNSGEYTAKLAVQVNLNYAVHKSITMPDGRKFKLASEAVDKKDIETFDIEVNIPEMALPEHDPLLDVVNRIRKNKSGKIKKTHKGWDSVDYFKPLY